jgi:CHASE2 domain-containing sensor protein
MPFFQIPARLRPLVDQFDQWLFSPPKSYAAHLRQNLVIGLVIILLLSLVQEIEFVKVTRDQSIDWLIKINRGLPVAEGKAFRPFVFYDIDEKTYELWGEPFHIPREKIARLIDVAAKSQPAVIVVDVELDRTSGPEDIKIVESLRKLEADKSGPTVIVVKGFKLKEPNDAQPYLVARSLFLDSA